jgi:hypothetical protein
MRWRDLLFYSNFLSKAIAVTSGFCPLRRHLPLMAVMGANLALGLLLPVIFFKVTTQQMLPQ